MEGFKIINYKAEENPTEITHLRAKCRKTKMDFIIRLEHEKNGWCLVYASKEEMDAFSSNMSGGRKEYELKFSDNVFVGKEYACPYCGNKDLVKCSSCGRFTCSRGIGIFKCAYCKNTGIVSGKVTSAYVEHIVQKGKK